MRKIYLLITLLLASLASYAGPDLDITATSFDKSQASAGEIVNASITFKNIGDANASEPTIEIYLSPSTTTLGTYMFSKEYSFSISPSNQITENISLQIPSGLTPGSYYFKVRVDCNNDANQTNNKHNEPITITSTSFDLFNTYIQSSSSVTAVKVLRVS